LYPASRLWSCGTIVAISGAGEQAGEASLAAHEQVELWAMHKELFANQYSIHREHLRDTARKMGLDVPQFAHARAARHAPARVRRDIDAAKPAASAAC
ncbi:MAG: hypothetical protein LC659_10660, partial [Myxococcales bacterium]|nr:hypothetical protein [Myxococcales bacterium]